MSSVKCGLTAIVLLLAGCGRSQPWGALNERSEREGVAGAGGGSSVAGSGGSDRGATGGGGGEGAAAAGSGGTSGSGPGTVAGGGGNSGASGDPPGAVPLLRLPRNGDSTGSALSERALRPVFGWDAVAGATAYEIEIDADCPASDFASCTFPSPERRERSVETRYVPSEALPVSLVAPVGTRYYWRVRACAGACGTWSSVRYVDVGRQWQDLDGDGYADLWIRRSLLALGQGVVDVYFGPPPFARHVSLKDGAADPADVDYFGSGAEPVGDVNLDGYSDLAVGCPRSSPNGASGSVFLFLGGPELAAGAPTYVAWDGAPMKSFGAEVVALGDVNADGGSDFAVGGAWNLPQSLSLFLGASLMHAPRYELLPAGQAHSLVPSSAGDVDADGYADFIAIESDTHSRQWLETLHGAPTPAQMQRAPEGELEAGRTTFIIGDVDGDGFSERASSTEFATGETPAVDVTFGRPAAPNHDTVRFDTGVIEAASVSKRTAVSTVRNAGDIDGDGLDETAVAIRLNYSAQIDVALFFGGAGARTAADLVYRFQQAEPLYISTGATHAAGDVNGDGFDDLFVVSDWDRLGRLFLGGATPDTEVDQVIGQ